MSDKIHQTPDEQREQAEADMLGISADEPEATDPTQCSGDEGFCPEHGYHRHALKQPGETTPSRRAGLRDDLARAIHRYDHDHLLSGNDIPSKHHRGEADAVLALLYREWPWLRAEAEEQNITAGTPLICSDERLAEKITALTTDLGTARQYAAATAAQRDRLRQRMNALADRWDTALAVDKPYARTLRNEISVAPFDPDGAMTVQEYTERGRTLWAFRCWGTDTCDGWLGLGHHTQTSALLEREQHVAEAHTAPAPAATEATGLRTRIRQLAGEYPVSVPTNLLDAALDSCPDELREQAETDPAGAEPVDPTQCSGTGADLLRQRIADSLQHYPADQWTPRNLAGRITGVIGADLDQWEQTARESSERLARAAALYEQWVHAGPPPLGTLMARWWDGRLVELQHAILDQPREQP